MFSPLEQFEIIPFCNGDALPLFVDSSFSNFSFFLVIHFFGLL